MLRCLRGTEARLRKLEKTPHFLSCKEGCYDLLCVDQCSAFLSFLIIGKIKLHLCRDIVWHIFSFIPISFNNGSYNDMWFQRFVEKFDLRMAQSKTLNEQRQSRTAQRQGLFQIPNNDLANFHTNSSFLSPFTKRLLKHVYSSNEKMRKQEY